MTRRTAFTERESFVRSVVPIWPIELPSPRPFPGAVCCPEGFRLAKILTEQPNDKAAPLQAVGQTESHAVQRARQRKAFEDEDDYEGLPVLSNTSSPTARTKTTLTNALLWKNARLIPARSRLAAARCS